METPIAEESPSLNKKLKIALITQLIVAAIVTIICVFAAWRIAPLVRQRAELTAQVAEQQAALEQAKSQLNEARLQLNNTQQHAVVSRQVLAAINSGNNAYSRGDMTAAIEYYDLGLKADPTSAYLWNLRGGVSFQQKDYSSAVESFKRATEGDPSYAYGFFDLSRGYCALNDFQNAEQAFERALTLWSDIKMIAASDGQFRRFCHPLVVKFDLPTVPPSEQPKWLHAPKNRFPDPEGFK